MNLRAVAFAFAFRVVLMSSNQSILVLLVRTNGQGREEFASFVGAGVYGANGLSIDRGDGTPPIPVPLAAMSGIRPCDESMQKAFAAADFVLSLRAAADSEEFAAFMQLSLDWHE